MKSKIRVGILFGGQSAEHEVSLQSAKNVVEALDPEKYEAILIGIDKSGQWHLNENSKFLLNSENPKLIALNSSGKSVGLMPGKKENQLVISGEARPLGGVDVIFPILHGPLGEDGTVQGMLKLANLPFVGSSVLGSAIGMDKDVTKRLLQNSGIPIGKFLVIRKHEMADWSYEKIVQELGAVFFVKPSNMGSSVGVAKVKNKGDFTSAVTEAFRYDRKILCEEFIPCRELEVAVLGNDHARASIVGEIIPQHEFYSYEAKYIDEQGALLKIPADISAAQSDELKQLALKTFKILECSGLARVDFFMNKNTGQIYLNEINTLPGFTSISMYPKLWEASGISYRQLIDHLLQLAMERHLEEEGFKTTAF